MTATEPIADGETLTVQIPLRLRKRGGRKLMVVPEGAVPYVPQRARVDNAMVKAIARAHRWRRLIESGEYATIREIANAERINETYVGRVLRLTLLAPDIVEAIINGRQPAGLQLDGLMRRFPAGWEEQRIAFRLITSTPQIQIRPATNLLSNNVLRALVHP
jgi:hypothetical protein